MGKGSRNGRNRTGSWRGRPNVSRNGGGPFLRPPDGGQFADSSGRYGSGDPSGDGAPHRLSTFDLLVNMIAAAAQEHAHGDPRSARACAFELAEGSFRDQPRIVDRAAAAVLVAEATALWDRGWLPEDVHQITRRNVSETAARLAAGVIAEEFARYPEPTTHPMWFDQLNRIQAERWWKVDDPYLGQWARRLGLERVTALSTAIHLLGLWITLPPLPTILPLPGKASPVVGTTNTAGVDKAMLSKVRALLAKAESTEYPQEAEALSAKAQDLMSRYAIGRAMLDVEEHTPQLASARRIWLDNPYLSAKGLLVANVANANRCRTVSHQKLGFVAVLGDEVDLDTVELLTTSLMVQATKAMIAHGSQITRTGQSRTRSFRQSFLLSYATRIGERLREAASAGVAEAGAALVPVFKARQEAVDDLFETLYPNTVKRSYSVGNAAGWGAGRVAADRAKLRADRGAISES